MATKKFRTPYNGLGYATSYEKNDGVSLTVPDQSMTVRQLVQRYASGLPLTGTHRVGLYHGDDTPFPNFEQMDFAEQREVINAAKEEMEAIKVELNKKASDLKKKKFQAKQKEALEKQLAETNKQATDKKDQR